ncbi:hypothetical protein WJX77_010576 [Trebouxia sp. C0004]
MMLWPACMSVCLLLWGRRATFAQPVVVPAALEVYSDAVAPRCGVSYLVLRAAMDTSCSNCGANPSSWSIMQTPSRLHVTPLYDQEAPVDHVQQEAAGCIYELNATVIKTTSLRSTEDDVFETAGSRWLNTWSVRTAVLLCLVLLQQIAPWS